MKPIAEVPAIAAFLYDPSDYDQVHITASAVVARCRSRGRARCGVARAVGRNKVVVPVCRAVGLVPGADGRKF